MTRELVVLWAGRQRRDEWESLCERYRQRLARFVRLNEIPVRARGAGAGKSRLRAEGEALLAAVPAGSWTVALDRQGTARSSPEIATWIERLMGEWPHPIAFLVGSDMGLDREVCRQTRERLSLGPLTLPHELARLVLFEQIYRAFCITAGIKYHREPL